MTDNTFEVDKEEYPLDVLFCPDKEGGYLIEGKDKSGKYRPVSAIKSPIYAPISLKITPPFTYSLNAGSLSGSTFYVNAKFSNRWNSLSFFGTKREIKNIYIEILFLRMRIYVRVLMKFLDSIVQDLRNVHWEDKTRLEY